MSINTNDLYIQNSSAYFLGDQSNDSLQRIRGVAFPDKKLMAEHLKFLEEAEKRNHLKIGKEQELFFFDELSPGSPFMLPNGTKILNQIQSLLRTEYRKRGYQEVQTPNMFDINLWKVSNLESTLPIDLTFANNSIQDLWPLAALQGRHVLTRK